MKRKQLQHILQELKDLISSIKTGRKKAGSNSELQPRLFQYTQEPLGSKKRFSLAVFKSRIAQKRRIKKESFVSPAKVHKFRKKIRPWVVSVLAISIFLVIGGPAKIGYLLKDISKFKVRNLAIQGCSSVTVKRIEELSGITLYKTSLLELELGKIAKRLEQEPWVKQAVVRRDWPSGVVIEVQEYSPVALLNVNTKGDPELFYIDKKGNTFLKVGPGLDVDYPVITGLDEVADKGLREEIFNDIMTFLVRARKNNPNLPAQSVSEVHINRHAEMVVYLVDHPFPIFFGKGDIVTKFYRLLRVMESMYREKQSESLLSGVKYIQMDYFNDKVLVAQSGSG